MSSSEAAAALGVKPTSLYAYVSRGVIARHVEVVGGRRVSRFRRGDVLALAAQRARPRSGVLTTLIESDVTQLDAEGVLAFRGVDVAECVRWGFERTALHVLGDSTMEWPPSGRKVGRSGCGRATDTIRQVVLESASSDPDRANTDAAHCRRVAAAAVESGTRALTARTPGSVAQRLTRWWADGAVNAADRGRGWFEGVASAVDVALTVLVDHELTASTLAARAAAGVWADPWMVMLAGLAAMSGPGQARASRAAVGVLRAWRDGEVPRTDRVPGFGHKVYVGPDPRAELLLTAVAEVAPALAQLVESLAVHMARTTGMFPNIDLALAALSEGAGLPEEAGEVIFTLARIPGVMAHAIEEYPHPLRLRPRALG